jgi:HlyD family secretion protein
VARAVNQRLTARILIEERPNVLKVERGPFLEAGGGNRSRRCELPSS